MQAIFKTEIGIITALTWQTATLFIFCMAALFARHWQRQRPPRCHNRLSSPLPSLLMRCIMYIATFNHARISGKERWWAVLPGIIWPLCQKTIVDWIAEWLLHVRTQAISGDNFPSQLFHDIARCDHYCRKDRLFFSFLSCRSFPPPQLSTLWSRLWRDAEINQFVLYFPRETPPAAETYETHS